MQSIKNKITSIVSRWELEHYATFLTFLEARKEKTKDLKNKFAELPGDGFIERLLYEIPEDLDMAINNGLADEEKAFLRSKEGGKWFARTFKQYNVSEKT